MKLSEIVAPKHISLDLKSSKKDQVLIELVDLLNLKPHSKKSLLATLQAREDLGSTAIGRGIAIPHCRSLVAGKLLVAIGISRKGIPFRASDRKRARLFFLIAAPPIGDPGEYLIALGKIAEVAPILIKDKRFKRVETPKELLDLIGELEK
jgi:mannitol/fructose-specific phosphotransferase system IIA component (Ntr-type)